MDEKKSKISYTEWGLVIGALFVIDLIQLGLDLLFQIGVILNRLIDIFVGMSFALYLQLRGESLADMKRLFGLLTAFVAEEIPDLDALPFWTLDGIYSMSLSKGKENLQKIPGGKLVISGLERAGKNASQMQNITPSPNRINTMNTVRPMSNDKFNERREKQKVELDRKSELERREREKRYESYEESSQRQRKFVEEHGGYEKYNKDLADLGHIDYSKANRKEGVVRDLVKLRYKYRNSRSSPDSEAGHDKEA